MHEKTQSGKLPSASQCSAWGWSSRSTKARIETRNASCSGVKKDVATAGIERMIVAGRRRRQAAAPTSADAVASTTHVPSDGAERRARPVMRLPGWITTRSRPPKVTRISDTEAWLRRAETRTDETATGQLLAL